MFSCAVEREGRHKEHHWCVREVLSADGTHWACHSPKQCVLPRSTLLRLQGALRGHCPTWTLHFMHFPGLRRSGSRVLHKGPGPDGLCVLCPSSIRAAQVTKRLVSTLSQVSRVSCTSQVLTTQVPGCSTRAWSQFPGCPLSPLGS